jgi:hypothetical protein
MCVRDSSCFSQTDTLQKKGKISADIDGSRDRKVQLHDPVTHPSTHTTIGTAPAYNAPNAKSRQREKS